MPVTSPQGTLDFKKVDKITFVGASSNTVIDTTTGSVGIGVDGNGPTSNLHVVGHTRLEGDINMLHTSNTASIKLNSNVVTEFPRSKKLIKYPRVAIASGQSGLNTGYTQDNYKIQVSTEWTNASSYAATNAFDNKFILDSWLSGQDTYSTDGTAENATSPDVFQDIKGSWINIQLPDRIVLDHFTITNRISSSIRNGNTGILWAKNKTDSTWFRIHDFSGLNTASSATNTIHTNQTIAYDEYRLQITKIEPYNGIAGLSIGEWQLFGVPEYDPEAHGTDVVVKSVANVPNTDWFEVYYDAKGLTDISSGVSDLSGNSINGVVTGATLGTDENIDIFNFDGQNDIIQGTFSGHTLSSGYTMATWIKPGDIGADDYIATFGVGSNGTAFGINFQTVEGAFRAFIWGSTTPGIVAQTNDGVVTKNKWVHVAATFISEDGTIHLYIDNKLTATGTGTALSSISASAPLVLGARNSGGTIQRHANFKMANFRLFNRTLTSDEIYQLYAYQKKDFGHGDLSMTLKAGRLGIGTSEPRAMLDVRGDIYGGCPVLFKANIETPANSTLSSSSPASPVIWNRVSWNKGGGYDSSNGKFTAPIDGYYSFNHWAMSKGNDDINFQYKVNGAVSNDLNPIRNEPYQTPSGSHTQNSGTTTFKLRSGDYVELFLTGGSMFVSATGSAMYNSYEGYYLSSW